MEGHGTRLWDQSTRHGVTGSGWRSVIERYLEGKVREALVFGS